jgi:hypothetical protein
MNDMRGELKDHLEKNQHYKFVEKVGKIFAEKLNRRNIKNISDTLVAHGDKAYGYKDDWDEHDIPFCYGVIVYLLSYEQPYSSSVRSTPDGWVPPGEWVIGVFEDLRQPVTKFPEIKEAFLELNRLWGLKLPF